MKKALITGASSGLGLEIGKLLQKEGVEVVNLSRSESPFENVAVNLADNKQMLNAINIVKKKTFRF